MHWLKYAILALFAALAPVHTVMGTSLALVVIDLIVGVWASYKRGDKITSAELRRTVSKLLIYELAIISGFLVEHNLAGGIIPIVKLVGSAIGLVEVKSILENLDSINGSPLFASLVKMLGSKNAQNSGDKSDETK